MGRWHILGIGSACAWGALIFLKLVADEIASTSASLRLLEEWKRKAKAHRKAPAAQEKAVGDVAA